MKRLFFLSVILCFTLIVSGKEKTNKTKPDSGMPATVAITGIVSDEVSGESLAGVEVKLAGTEIKTYTDFDGRFTFSNIKPSEYRVVTSYISYEKREVTLPETASKDGQVSIKLKPSI
jgi:hypothetical protein